MPAKKKKPRTRGASRMYQLGYKPSQLWFTPQDAELIRTAAKLDGRNMANFIKNATLRAAAARVLNHKDNENYPVYPYAPGDETPEVNGPAES